MAPVERLRLGIFAGAIVLVYWLALRWGFDRLRGQRGSSLFERAFHASATGIVLGLLALNGLLCFAYGALIEPRRLTVTEYRMETTKIPLGEQVRIVHLADLHVRSHGPREVRLPELVRGLKPDLILHTGDFFGGKDPSFKPIIVELLREWDVPQFACEGNLDCLGDFDGTMAESRVNIPRVACKTIQIRRAKLTIAGFPSGFDSAFTQDQRVQHTPSPMNKALRHLPKDTFNIVLYHHPQGFPDTWGTHTDLMLAGHIHGGQVRLPWYGALITLDAAGKRWEYGLYEEHGVHLEVSRGVGCEPHVPEVRFLCPPEVVVIDLIGAGRTRN